MISWSKPEQEDANVVTSWALAACSALNKNSGKDKSQLGHALSDIDLTNDRFDDWSEARLTQTLGTRDTVTPGGGECGYSGGSV